MQELLLLDDKTKSMVEEYAPSRKTLEKLSRTFALFSDVTRLRIISALCVSDMCVTDLARVLEMNQTTLSHQLKFLRDSALVTTFRLRKIVFYRIDSEKVDKMMLSCMDLACIS